jgi:polyhydroxyalkanoate synthesis regulator phasin
MAEITRLVERAFFTSLGAVLFVQERTAEAVRELVERGRLAPEEGRRFLDDISSRVEADAETLRNTINKMVQESLKEAGLATKQEIRELREQLEKLEQRLS